MIDNFKTDLILRAAQFSREDILQRMGYQRQNGTLRQRLERVLTSEYFGLEKGGFDLRFSGPEFVRALCRVLDMDPEIIDQRIASIQQYLEEERSAFKSYIWVDTGFKRPSQPIFALALLEHQRYLGFPKGL